jgi:lipopolysaccharide transport system permease protein
VIDAGDVVQAPPAIRRISATPPRVRDVAHDAWARRRLAVHFGRRFNNKRYARTVIGPLWLLLRPLLMVGWQIFVFAVILPAPETPVPFVLTFLAGFAVWHLFSESCFWATRSLELNRGALRMLPAPAPLLLVGAVGPAIVDTALCVLFLVTALAAYAVVDHQLYLEVSANALLIPPALVALVLVGLGIAMLLAGPGAIARDVRFGLRFVLSAWYFFTPIVYSLEQAPSGVRTLLELNPATAPVQAIRLGLFGTGELPALAVASTSVWVVALLAVGVPTLLRADGRVRDRL